MPVEPGQWYEARAWASASGGEAFLRITWYASADGSGSGADQADGEPVSGGWAPLAAGPFRAPVDARSARVRLMLRPSGTATACFDDAWFDAVDAPPPTPTPAPKPSTSSAAGSSAPAAAATASPAPTRAASAGSSSPRPSAAPAAPSAGNPAALRISEIMSDPPEPGRDAPFEWVEIVNTGAEPVDLAGWVIADASASDTLPAAVIPPGGYAVIAGASAVLPADVPVVRVPDGEIGNGLGNTGDLLRLRDPAGRTVDEVSFGTRTDVFDPPLPAPEAGETIGLRDSAAEPAPENWAVTLRPTPGQPNVFAAAVETAVAGASAAGASPQASRAGATLQVEEGGDGGSVVPWMVLGGLAGISVGMLGAAIARAVKRARERRGRRKPRS
ncbi:MAG: hypothetical protein KatS3mg064_1818 [Tepidiforma sp.]|nr:lamin tail domain-containing protein [Tepidiforma sp.]GIW18661.1 MAG: hypothetical protein KatS3mg064_1818 [Tepidiforma sp.]